jgi:hypothetical protein
MQLDLLIYLTWGRILPSALALCVLYFTKLSVSTLYIVEWWNDKWTMNWNLEGSGQKFNGESGENLERSQ